MRKSSPKSKDMDSRINLKRGVVGRSGNIDPVSAKVGAVIDKLP